MVSKQTVQVLIEAEERVSKIAKKAEDALNRLGKSGSKSMDRINNVSSKVQDSFSKLNTYVDKARDKFNQLKNSNDKLAMIKSTISNAANSFGELVNTSDLAAKAMEKLKSVSDGVQSKFTGLSTKIKSFGASASSTLKNAFQLNGIKERLSSIGSSIDNLKVKLRSLASEAKKTGSGGFGFLRNAASMTAGMIGYDLVNSFAQSGREALNAQGQLEYFGKRLNMSAKTTASFNNYLGDMQKSFRKVNMKAVGASAEEMAVKLKLPTTSLRELTKTTAVMSSAFVKEGRTQEDAILAVSDAMDGQFRRLQELGISQDMLKNNGWSGDLNDKNSLLKAMNKTLDEMGFTQTAQDITTLDEAFQALGVAGGDLLASVLIPLTPYLIAIMDAAILAADGIKDFIKSLQEGWSNLPEWAQIAIGIGAVALAIGVAVAAFGGLESVLIALLGPLVSVIGVIGAISWPLVAVVAAIGLVIAAIYEVGKAFGWWNDVQGMLAAIADGLGKIWNAFINHPDVQAAISAISGALSWLGGAVTWVGQKVLEFFGISTGSKWDIVTDIINAIGGAWDGLKGAVGTVIGVFQAIYNFAAPIGQAIYEALKPIVCIILGCSPGIVPALRMAYEVFVEIWNAILSFIQPIISVIVNTFQLIILAVERFKNGQLSLPGLIMTVLTLLWNAYNTILTKIASFILQFAGKMLTYAIRAGRNFVNTIITWISQLPGRIHSLLLQVLSRINSAGQQWITNAKQKAKGVVDGAYTTLASLPDRVTSALSGVVNAIVQPFRKAYDDAKKVWDDIVSLANNIPGVGAAGGEILAAGGETATDLATGEIFNINNGSTKSETKVEGTLNLNLNLENVPAHIDTETLIKILTSKEVLDKVVGSNEFQTVDATVKSKIGSRNKRARGV